MTKLGVCFLSFVIVCFSADLFNINQHTCSLSNAKTGLTCSYVRAGTYKADRLLRGIEHIEFPSFGHGSIVFDELVPDLKSVTVKETRIEDLCRRIKTSPGVIVRVNQNDCAVSFV